MFSYPQTTLLDLLKLALRNTQQSQTLLILDTHAPVAVEEANSLLGDSQPLGHEPPQELDGVRGGYAEFELASCGRADVHAHHL